MILQLIPSSTGQMPPHKRDECVCSFLSLIGEFL